MEPDPLGLKAGLNPYAYTGNNPVNQVDSTGLCIEDLCVGEIIAARYAIMIATPYVVQGANYVYINAPGMATIIESLLPSSAGAMSSALGLASKPERQISECVLSRAYKDEVKGIVGNEDHDGFISKYFALQQKVTIWKCFEK
ncbi:hypothetical protein HYN46_07015 [Aquirhabdus parva]|uniref:RHS repeat-associated core domain-containing protein n=2 Tax=Aquirhabdus parva TaxID=2283318 RepID=A0A345P5N9_9GAMM|nr:hypothetical protein HYN46_07015 [Aquirhabdus parva]